VTDLDEWHICIRFCCKLGTDATETSEVWKIAYGQQAVEEYKLLDGFPSSKAV
jgi:hypothetical protein